MWWSLSFIIGQCQLHQKKKKKKPECVQFLCLQSRKRVQGIKGKGNCHALSHLEMFPPDLRLRQISVQGKENCNFITGTVPACKLMEHLTSQGYERSEKPSQALQFV